MRTFVLLAVAVLLSGCSLLPGGDGEQQVVVYPQGERPAAPEIRMASVAGDGELALDQFDGPVVLNFWASWCGPCRTEAPHLNAVAELYADEGVHVVGVNSKDDLVNAQAFARGNFEFPSFYDPQQAIAAGFGAGGPLGLPSTLILDADHDVAVRFFGTVSGATLTPYIDQVLEEARGGVRGPTASLEAEGV